MYGLSMLLFGVNKKVFFKIYIQLYPNKTSVMNITKYFNYYSNEEEEIKRAHYLRINIIDKKFHFIILIIF